MARLIDADEFRNEINEYIYPIIGNNLIGGADVFYRVLHLLEEMPTIEAEPVRHGKWIKDNERDMLRCSVCQNFYVENYMFWFKYCTDCGARMDGDQE